MIKIHQILYKYSLRREGAGGQGKKGWVGLGVRVREVTPLYGQYIAVVSKQDITSAVDHAGKERLSAL